MNPNQAYLLEMVKHYDLLLKTGAEMAKLGLAAPTPFAKMVVSQFARTNLEVMEELAFLSPWVETVRALINDKDACSTIDNQDKLLEFVEKYNENTE